MRLNKVQTIVKKEIDDVIKSKYVLSSIIGMPLVFAVLMPLLLMLPLLLDPQSMLEETPAFLQNINFTFDWNNLDSIQQTFVIFAELSLLFFLILPIIMPTIIAADSLSGEKDRGTAEGLVVAPVTDSEIYVSKIGGALVPTVLSTWFFAIVFMLITNYFSLQILDRIYFPSFNAVFFIFFMGPLMGFAATNVMVWVSSRTSNTRDAQQLGSLVILPLILIFMNSFILIYLLPRYVIIAIVLVFIIIDVLLAKLGIKILDREKWVS